MVIADFVFGLEFLALMCTLIFIITMLVNAPVFTQPISKLLALFNFTDENYLDIDLYYSSNIKRSLMNQQVMPR